MIDEQPTRLPAPCFHARHNNCLRSIRPQPLNQPNTGYDSSKWKIASFVTNNISFPSAQAIIDEWATPGSRLHSRKFQLPTGEDELLSSFAK